jgi:hypothetical protein
MTKNIALLLLAIFGLTSYSLAEGGGGAVNPEPSGGGDQIGGVHPTPTVVQDYLSIEIYDAQVDCSFTIKELKKEFDWVDEDLVLKNLENSDMLRKPLPCKDGPAKVAVFHFNRSVFRDEAMLEMNKEGYRPAILAELRALAKAKPDLQRKMHIVAPGSQDISTERDGSLPSLAMSVQGRALLLHSPGGWNDFAAVLRK